MSKPFRVLSIDFDYFQNVTEQTLSKYPDGCDMGTHISECVWASRYSEKPELYGVSLPKEAFDLMCGIVMQQDRTCPAMIVNSHKHIYDFIKDCIADGEYDSLHIVNVDMHHDVCNDNETLDCGNWGIRLHEDILPTSIEWVYPPVAEKVFCSYRHVLFDAETFDTVVTETHDSLLDVQRQQFDAIFLCRSDMWLAPHLDKWFSVLAQVVLASFDNVCGEEQVLQPRHDYKALARKYRKQIIRLREQYETEAKVV